MRLSRMDTKQINDVLERLFGEKDQELDRQTRQLRVCWLKGMNK